MWQLQSRANRRHIAVAVRVMAARGRLAALISQPPLTETDVATKAECVFVKMQQYIAKRAAGGSTRLLVRPGDAGFALVAPHMHPRVIAYAWEEWRLRIDVRMDTYGDGAVDAITFSWVVPGSDADDAAVESAPASGPTGGSAAADG